MPSPTSFRPVSTSRVKRPPGRPSNKARWASPSKSSRHRQDSLVRHPVERPTANPRPEATTSQETLNRLIGEAKTDSRFSKTDEIQDEVNRGLAIFLKDYPWWYGRTDDTKHHAAQRQYRVRRERERLARLSLSLSNEVAE